jgi:hypothetical protein
LLIYGDGHLARKDVLQNFEPSPPNCLLPKLENDGTTKVFSIFTETSVDLSQLQADVATWRKASLAMLRGTVQGNADVTSYVREQVPRFASLGKDGPDFSKPLPRSEWRALRMEDQFDAVLYLGPPSDITMSRLPAALCNDRAYMEMRLQRLTFAGLQRQIDRLREHCDRVSNSSVAAVVPLSDCYCSDSFRQTTPSVTVLGIVVAGGGSVSARATETFVRVSCDVLSCAAFALRTGAGEGRPMVGPKN